TSISHDTVPKRSTPTRISGNGCARSGAITAGSVAPSSRRRAMRIWFLSPIAMRLSPRGIMGCQWAEQGGGAGRELNHRPGLVRHRMKRDHASDLTCRSRDVFAAANKKIFGGPSMATARARVLAGVMAAAAILGWQGLAFSPSPEPGDPTYHSLRYNDDFSHLANQPASPDFWDPLKYIPIGNGQYGPTWLSLGGELRERFESYLNPNFGIKAPKSNAYLEHRLLLNADLHLTDYVRVFLQLG